MIRETEEPDRDNGGDEPEPELPDPGGPLTEGDESPEPEPGGADPGGVETYGEESGADLNL